jgi:hypothetical protein
MKLKDIFTMATTTGLIFLASGCASIVDGGPKKIAIKSDPSEASITIYDKKDAEVWSGQTPATAKLKRSSSAKYRVVIAKTGYKPAEFELKSTLNGWYIGNIFIGGLIGMLIVDPLTGAMWTLTPNQVDVLLEKQTPGSSQLLREKGGLIAILRKNVPEEFASKLVRLDNQLVR